VKRKARTVGSRMAVLDRPGYGGVLDTIIGRTPFRSSFRWKRS